MSLHQEWYRFDAEATAIAGHFRNIALQIRPRAGQDFSFLDECILEGLLSRAWQSWCLFCRTCVVQSCIGTTTAGGTVLNQIPDALSEEHVSHAAILAKSMNNLPPFWGKKNSVLRKEPTWGDPDTITRIITRLQPNNHMQLSAAFSAGFTTARSIQIIRNASFHANPQTLLEVKSLSSAYISYPVSHPIQAVFWTDRASSDFLITASLQRLSSTGYSAIL